MAQILSRPVGTGQMMLIPVRVSQPGGVSAATAGHRALLQHLPTLLTYSLWLNKKIMTQSDLHWPPGIWASLSKSLLWLGIPLEFAAQLMVREEEGHGEVCIPFIQPVTGGVAPQSLLWCDTEQSKPWLHCQPEMSSLYSCLHEPVGAELQQEWMSTFCPMWRPVVCAVM